MPWTDPDEAPERTQDWFDKATLKIGDAVVRMARRAAKVRILKS